MLTGMTRSILRDLPAQGIDIDLAEIDSAYKKIAQSRHYAAAANETKPKTNTGKTKGLGRLISGFKRVPKSGAAAA